MKWPGQSSVWFWCLLWYCITQTSSGWSVSDQSSLLTQRHEVAWTVLCLVLVFAVILYNSNIIGLICIWSIVSPDTETWSGLDSPLSGSGVCCDIVSLKHHRADLYLINRLFWHRDMKWPGQSSVWFWCLLWYCITQTSSGWSVSDQSSLLTQRHEVAWTVFCLVLVFAVILYHSNIIGLICIWSIVSSDTETWSGLDSLLSGSGVCCDIVSLKHHRADLYLINRLFWHRDMKWPGQSSVWFWCLLWCCITQTSSGWSVSDQSSLLTQRHEVAWTVFCLVLVFAVILYNSNIIGLICIWSIVSPDTETWSGLDSPLSGSGVCCDIVSLKHHRADLYLINRLSWHRDMKWPGQSSVWFWCLQFAGFLFTSAGSSSSPSTMNTTPTDAAYWGQSRYDKHVWALMMCLLSHIMYSGMF